MLFSKTNKLKIISSGGNHHSFVAIVLKDVANYATRWVC